MAVQFYEGPVRGRKPLKDAVNVQKDACLYLAGNLTGGWDNRTPVKIGFDDETKTLEIQHDPAALAQYHIHTPRKRNVVRRLACRRLFKAWDLYRFIGRHPARRVGRSIIVELGKPSEDKP